MTFLTFYLAVTGSVALIQQMHPTWSSQQIKCALSTTAMQIEEREPGALFSQGSGRINVEKAIHTSTFISPTHLSLNPTDGQATLLIFNDTDQLKPYSVRWEGAYEVFNQFPFVFTVGSRQKQGVTFVIKSDLVLEEYAGRIIISDGVGEFHTLIWLSKKIPVRGWFDWLYRWWY